MAKPLPDEILMSTSSPDLPPMRSRIAAFVPITIALMGVAAILLGRVTAHDNGATDVRRYLDPVVTGSITAQKPVADAADAR